LEAVFRDVDARVAEKIEELWQQGQQRLGKMQERHKEQTDRFLQDIGRCRERQHVLEADNENLRQALRGLCTQFAVMGVPDLPGDLPTAAGLGNDAAFSPVAASVEATPIGLSAALGEPAGVALDKQGLPEIPLFPFAQALAPPLPSVPAPTSVGSHRPACGAANLSLAEALGMSPGGSTDTTTANTPGCTPQTPTEVPSPFSFTGAMAGAGAGVFNITLRKADGV
jgi:hypothetical protein